MKFMAIMIPDVYKPGKKIDPNFAPPAGALERMMKFNAEMQKAGLIDSLNGLHPLSTKGARVSFSNGKAKVTDGPFVEAKEVVGGYWLLEAKSKEEVVNWMKKCPADDGDTIEIRQIFDVSEFPIAVEKAARS